MQIIRGGFHFYVFATPVANPASWIALVYIIIEVTNRIVYGRKSIDLKLNDGEMIPPGDLLLFKGG